MNGDGYRWTLEQILEEERRLRSLAEEQVRAYRKVLLGLAIQLAPHIVDAGRRENPQFPNHLSPQAWQELFIGIAQSPLRPKAVNGWYGQQQLDVSHTERRVQQLEAENQQLRQQAADSTAANERLARQLQRADSSTANRQARDGAPPIDPATPAASDTPAVLLPANITLPATPPSRFTSLFHTWAREGLVLALLATTGWSLRHAIDEAMAERLGIAVGSGSIKRAFKRLETHGLVSQPVYDLGTLQAAILLLTEKGATVAKASGFEPVPSEWSILMREHGGEQQAQHAALCCTFAYQARKRGWMVQLCPDVTGAAQPDLLISKEDASLYVEVEAESGEPERRMRKWRNQADLQGVVALCANSESVRARLVAEAKATASHGLATDVSSLIQMARNDEDGFWVETWGDWQAVGGRR